MVGRVRRWGVFELKKVIGWCGRSKGGYMGSACKKCMVIYKKLFKVIKDKFVCAIVMHFVIKDMCVIYL